MGFKSKARKARGDSSKSDGKKRRRKELEDGEKPCCIKGCDTWADKSHGGRSIAFDNLADVWDEDELVGEFASHAIDITRRKRRKTRVKLGDYSFDQAGSGVNQ